MPDALLIGTLYNTAIVLAVALLFDLAHDRDLAARSTTRPLALGAGLGVLAVATMAAGVPVQPGVIFDARSVVLSLGGLFFGAWAALSAALVALAYRLWLGGAGALTGALVIVVSAAIGVVWRRAVSGDLRSLRHLDLVAFGLVVTGVELALFTTLPDGLHWELWPILAPINLVAHPLATVVVGLLLLRKVRHADAAQRLAEAEARYRTLFEHSPSVMFLVEPDTLEIVDANAAAEAYYGYGREQLRSMNIQEINTSSRELLAPQVSAVRRNERTQFSFQHRLADGSVRDVEVFAAAVRVGGRELLHSIIHDVTERVEAMQAVRARDHALRLQAAALAATANPIVITDIEGRIEWVNPAFTETTGYTFREAVGRNPREILNAGVHPEAFFSQLWSTVLDGRVWTGRLTNRRKDGTHYQEEQTITPVRDDEGRITHFVAVKLDVSERIAIEERLRSSQKMETLGQLAGGVAHDFNNLLTVILGTADLALEELHPGGPQHEEVTAIRDTARRAADLTRQLLTFSRRQLVPVRVLDLNDVVRELSKMLQRLIGEDVILDTRLSGREVPVRADTSQLQQVIINLVVNARDALPDGGQITVEITETAERLAHGVMAATLDGGHPPRARWARLKVSDNGVGMPPAVAEKIFEPFFTTKPEGKGTGLGLATVYGIVGQAGGDIKVESEVGVGTTFTVFLPVAEAQAGDASDGVEARAPVSPGGGASILMVEDDPDIRRMAERVLTRAGHQVRATASPEEAIALLGEAGTKVDLLFTDVVMPGMSGPELVRRARGLRPALRVLMASGYAGEEFAGEVLVGSHDIFLAKPYTLEELTEAVAAALAARR